MTLMSIIFLKCFENTLLYKIVVNWNSQKYFNNINYFIIKIIF